MAEKLKKNGQMNQKEEEKKKPKEELEAEIKWPKNLGIQEGDILFQKTGRCDIQ